MTSLAQAIKDEARRRGFVLAGFTTPDAPPHLEVYARWLQEGRHGEMAYLASESARQRRADPRLLLPECGTILVLAVPYQSTPAPAPPTAELPGGRVAAYAWGDDYHDVLLPRLKSLTAFIEAQLGRPIPNRWYTDTGPLLERELAQRAGLGWIGKNTCLINPERGSYLLLAEILLGLDLPPDPPFSADRCGHCTRCIAACPTGCIRPDRTLDARRCLSYLTIELKSAIPAELRPALGNWVFGCDVCQQVCPWNRRGAPGDPAFAPRPGVPRPNLIEALSLDPQNFNHRFKLSPLRRAKRRGYLRNVAVALGNAGNAAAVPHLAHTLEHEPEPLVRAHAAWALGRLGGILAHHALTNAASRETEASVLAEIGAALHTLNDKANVPPPVA